MIPPPKHGRRAHREQAEVIDDVQLSGRILGAAGARHRPPQQPRCRAMQAASSLTRLSDPQRSERPTQPNPTHPGTLASGPPRRRRPLRAPWPGPGLRRRRAAALPRRRPPPSSPPPPPGCPKQPPGSDAYRRPLRARSGWCARFGSPQRPTSTSASPPATPPAAWGPQPNRRLVLASRPRARGPRAPRRPALRPAFHRRLRALLRAARPARRVQRARARPLEGRGAVRRGRHWQEEK